jgi:hypothetical protein
MAQALSLRGKADALRRRFRHVSPNRFFYNKRAELSRRYRVITTWFIIHDAGRGYSIMNMDFRRKERPGIRQWLRGFTEPGIVGEVSLMHVFTQLVLPAINTKTGSEWKFKALLGWTGKLDTPKIDGSTTSKRDKDASKRRRKSRGKHRRG